MIQTILTALLTFVGTTLDDIFVVTVIFAGAKSRKDKTHIVLGEYLGILTTFLLGVVGALATNILPDRFVGLLGLVPIAIGLSEIVEHIRKNEDEETTVKSLGVLSVALISLSNGGDNVGVYIPLFADYTPMQLLVTGAVFCLCIAGLCFVADRIGSLPKIRHFTERYKHILVPAILIGLGIFILLQHYVF